jgi:uncharacterized membrane protein YjgN (DUF898 family)
MNARPDISTPKTRRREILQQFYDVLNWFSINIVIPIVWCFSFSIFWENTNFIPEFHHFTALGYPISTSFLLLLPIVYTIGLFFGRWWMKNRKFGAKKDYGNATGDTIGGILELFFFY